MSRDILAVLLFAFHEGASAKNHQGKLPLHYAVANISDAALVGDVLDAFPQALREKEPRNASLPLHYACAFKAPLPVVQLLCERYPEAAGQPNGQGNLPLHLALLYETENEIVQYLIGLNPDAGMCNDDVSDWQNTVLLVHNFSGYFKTSFINFVPLIHSSVQ